MDTTKLEATVRETLQHKELNLDLPPVEFIGKSSKLITARKQIENVNNDIFYVIAQFLNMKIKMYQVIILFITAISIYFYFDNTKNKLAKSDIKTVPQEINTPINSYTVMACVKQTKLI